MNDQHKYCRSMYEQACRDANVDPQLFRAVLTVRRPDHPNTYYVRGPHAFEWKAQAHCNFDARRDALTAYLAKARDYAFAQRERQHEGLVR